MIVRFFGHLDYDLHPRIAEEFSIWQLN